MDTRVPSPSTALASRSRDAGFTLVEIMVALTILALILIPLFGGFSWSIGQTGLANQQTVATNLARQRLEAARVQAGTPAGFLALQTGGEARGPVTGTALERELLVAFDSSINIITLTVNVYQDTTAATPLVSLVTVVSP